MLGAGQAGSQAAQQISLRTIIDVVSYSPTEIILPISLTIASLHCMSSLPIKGFMRLRETGAGTNGDRKRPKVCPALPLSCRHLKSFTQIHSQPFGTNISDQLQKLWKSLTVIPGEIS